MKYHKWASREVLLDNPRDLQMSESWIQGFTTNAIVEYCSGPMEQLYPLCDEIVTYRPICSCKLPEHGTNFRTKINHQLGRNIEGRKRIDNKMRNLKGTSPKMFQEGEIDFIRFKRVQGKAPGRCMCGMVAKKCWRRNGVVQLAPFIQAMRK